MATPINKKNVKQTEVKFEGLGDNDGIEYSKVDLFKAGRVGTSFTLSGYQLDYQALVNALSGSSKIKPNDTELLVVSKLVMDFDAFMKLRNEINSLYDNLNLPSKTN